MELSYGFVSVCRSEQDCSPEGNVTVRQLESLEPSDRHYRLSRVAKQNLENTLRIMWFLRAHDVALYRISDNLIPQATNDLVSDWAWWEDEELREISQRIGRVAKQNDYRLSAHLPRVCGLIGPAAFRETKQHLEHLERLFSLMELDTTAKIVLGVGGGGRSDIQAALDVALRHIDKLSDWARERIVLENGDRAFSLEDIVTLGERAELPVSFDWHHHWLHHDESLSSAKVTELLERAFSLWDDRPPKIHLASPRSEEQPHLPADYVDIQFVRPLTELLADVDAPRVDIMVEARMNDLALFKLRDNLKAAETAVEAGEQIVSS